MTEDHQRARFNCNTLNLDLGNCREVASIKNALNRKYLFPIHHRIVYIIVLGTWIPK